MIRRDTHEADGRSPTGTLSGGQEVTNVHARLTKNRSESTLRHVAILARERHLPTGALVTPHFVASRPHPIEPVARTSQPTRYLPVPEPASRPMWRSVLQTLHYEDFGILLLSVFIVTFGNALKDAGNVRVIES